MTDGDTAVASTTCPAPRGHSPLHAQRGGGGHVFWVQSSKSHHSRPGSMEDPGEGAGTQVIGDRDGGDGGHVLLTLALPKGTPELALSALPLPLSPALQGRQQT